MTNADVVQRLGEPQGKPPKGNVVAMFVDYKVIGLQIDFTTVYAYTHPHNNK